MEKTKPLILIKKGTIDDSNLALLRQRADVVLVNDTYNVIRMD